MLGDQLSRSLSAFEDLDPAPDTVLLAEVMAECTYVLHHPKKILLVPSGMRQTLRMEFFYQDMRRQTGPLMNGALPEGGRWNYDAENRKRLPAGIEPPLPNFEPDAITREVMAMVAGRFTSHFGRVDDFAYPVTARDATTALDDLSSTGCATSATGRTR